MRRNKIQIGFGLLSAVAIFFLSDRLIPSSSTELSVALVRMSLLSFFAFVIGGVIATRGFVILATAFAALLWLTATCYSMYLGAVLENPLWDQFIWNLPSAILVPSVAVGAKLGTIVAGRFYIAIR